MPTRTLKDLNEAAGQGDLDQVKQIVEQLKDKNPQADIAKIYEVKSAVYEAATNGQLQQSNNKHCSLSCMSGNTRKCVKLKSPFANVHRCVGFKTTVVYVHSAEEEHSSHCRA